MKKSCSTYTKSHTNKKALDTHLKKIRARGGKTQVVKRGNKYVVTYKF